MQARTDYCRAPAGRVQKLRGLAGRNCALCVLMYIVSSIRHIQCPSFPATNPSCQLVVDTPAEVPPRMASIQQAAQPFPHPSFLPCVAHTHCTGLQYLALRPPSTTTQSSAQPSVSAASASGPPSASSPISSPSPPFSTSCTIIIPTLGPPTVSEKPPHNGTNKFLRRISTLDRFAR